jgi:uncharacterized protein involved in outer membrane biogenesis
MKKFVSWLIGILVILFIVIFIFWNILPTIVASKLSDKAKVDVSIGHIGVWPSSIDVQNIKMGNPSGSTLPHALKAQTLNAEVPFTHFFKDRVVISHMRLDDIYLGLEFKKKGSKKGNWTTIMNNLNQSNKSDESSKKTVLIKKLVLTDIIIDVLFRDEGKIRRLDPIRKLEFTNVSSEGGIPTAQISNLIMKHMLKEVFSIENLENMVEDIIKGQKEGVLDKLKDFFSSTPIVPPCHMRKREDFFAT